jgi:hypothetical protein
MIGRFMRDTDIPGQDSGEVWRCIMLLGIADTLSKDAANPDLEDAQRKRDLMRQMQEFKARPGPSTVKPLLNGYELMGLFPNLKVNQIADGKNFIKDINERLLDGQSAGTIMDKAQAQAFVENIRAEIEGKYGPKTASAWVKANCKFSES